MHDKYEILKEFSIHSDGFLGLKDVSCHILIKKKQTLNQRTLDRQRIFIVKLASSTRFERRKKEMMKMIGSVEEHQRQLMKRNE
ncbi:CLUMA_CG000991, isoform B [Clunio marinus]|uniref:CLUMA_CG000991, isoform B n=1 Tax=Clunio marinus TaxID=568069 RepID=A0A1J1HGP0_9DIPT|nr:CLUMA_CG000991, isoform B [Clunio marinus]